MWCLSFVQATSTAAASSIEEKVDEIINSLSTQDRIASLEAQGPIEPRNPLLDVNDPLAAESVSAEVDGENQARPSCPEHATPGQTVGGRGPVGLRDESSTATGRRDIQEEFLIIIKTLSKNTPSPWPETSWDPHGHFEVQPARLQSDFQVWPIHRDGFEVAWYTTTTTINTPGPCHFAHHTAGQFPVSTWRISGPTGKLSVRQLHSADLYRVFQGGENAGFDDNARADLRAAVEIAALRGRLQDTNQRRGNFPAQTGATEVVATTRTLEAARDVFHNYAERSVNTKRNATTAQDDTTTQWFHFRTPCVRASHCGKGLRSLIHG